MADIVIVALILGYGGWVLYRQKTSGHGACGGCSGSCAGCGGSCGCGGHGGHEKTAEKTLLHRKG